jgi:hypothetical protein
LEIPVTFGLDYLRKKIFERFSLTGTCVLL